MATNPLILSAVSGTSIARYAHTIAAIGLAESGGSQTARNPNSSATGWFQFIDSTWNAIADRDDRLLRTDQEHLNTDTTYTRLEAQGQAIAMAIFTEDNIKHFRNKFNRDPSGAEVYVMHFRGWNGAQSVFRQLEQDPDRLIRTYFGDDIMEANKSIRFNGKPFSELTTAEFMQWAEAKVPTNPSEVSIAQMTTEQRVDHFATSGQFPASDSRSEPSVTERVQDGVYGAYRTARRVGADFMENPVQALKDNWLGVLLGAVGLFAAFKLLGSLFGGIGDFFKAPVQEAVEGQTQEMRDAVRETTDRAVEGVVGSVAGAMGLRAPSTPDAASAATQTGRG